MPTVCHAGDGFVSHGPHILLGGKVTRPAAACQLTTRQHEQSSRGRRRRRHGSAVLEGRAHGTPELALRIHYAGACPVLGQKRQVQNLRC